MEQIRSNRRKLSNSPQVTPSDRELPVYRQGSARPHSAKEGTFAPEKDKSLEMALKWFDQDPRPRLITDASLEILWVNVAAGNALIGRRDLEIRNGLLAAVHSSKEHSLQSLLASTGGTFSSCCIPRHDGNGHLVLQCQWLSWDHGGTYGLTFYGSGTDYHAGYVSFASAFSLTKTEDKILHDLLNGLDADGISLQNSCSIETVRSHIKSIYLKLGVNSREGLFHKVRPFQL